MGKTLVIAEKPSVGRDLASALPGTFPKSEGYLESDDYVDHVGRRPPRPARRPGGVRREVQEVADGRPADRAGGVPPRPARREVEEAAQPHPQAAEARRRRPRHQRLRRRARGRADLRLHLRAVPERSEEEGRRAEAGRAPLDLLDDEAGDPRGLRAPAAGRADAPARGGCTVALRGRLDRRHERDARCDDPRPRLGRRRRLARPCADADAGDAREARARDPGVRGGAVLARARRVPAAATRGSSSRATRRGSPPSSAPTRSSRR